MKKLSQNHSDCDRIATKGASMFAKYPANLLLYFYFGIAIKLRFLNLNKEKIT